MNALAEGPENGWRKKGAYPARATLRPGKKGHAENRQHTGQTGSISCFRKAGHLLLALQQLTQTLCRRLSLPVPYVFTKAAAGAALDCRKAALHFPELRLAQGTRPALQKRADRWKQIESAGFYLLLEFRVATED